MILMFDAMARRYGKLPSELLKNADSFDIMVMDVGATYEAYQNSKHSKTKGSEFIDSKQMEEHFKKVKGRNGPKDRHKTS